jgi:hypothetical protein
VDGNDTAAGYLESNRNGLVAPSTDPMYGNKTARLRTTGPQYYYIMDTKHRRSIVAGDVYDGRIYHQDPGDRPNAIWTLEFSNAQGYYLIRDTKHQKCIVAGNDYDGQLYHQDPNGKGNDRWRIVKFKDEQTGSEAVELIDKRHNKAIVAGDVRDNHVYHQDPNNRPNARWILISTTTD